MQDNFEHNANSVRIRFDGDEGGWAITYDKTEVELSIASVNALSMVDRLPICLKQLNKLSISFAGAQEARYKEDSAWVSAGFMVLSS